MNRWVLLALLMLPGLARAAPGADLSAAQIAERATPSIVSIEVPQGLGTGFVVAADGRIVTNAHVIRGAREAKVRTADGREYTDVELMAADEAHDVVVLRIKASGLKPLPLGRASSAKPGEHVVAIGHPLGLGNTVSDGLVSAVRQVTPTTTVLQISAPISPGSSGGPVFNDQGEVIGIATLVSTEGQNLNFAVPIDVVKPLLASTRGIPLSAYVSPGQRQRDVPRHPPSLMAQCPAPDLVQLVGSIEQAIEVGAPLYNQGNIEACYRIYAAAVLDADRSLKTCAGPRRALLDGLAKADQLKSWDDKAWALRDAFDGLMLAAAEHARRESAPPPRQVPQLPADALRNCAPDNAARIADGIQAAINSGAPLYNQGNIEACYRIYAGAISELERSVRDCPGPRAALQAGQARADSLQDWDDKAWALRDAFDGVLGLVRPDSR